MAKLPTEYKKLKGTLNVTREKQKPAADVKISKINGIIFAGDIKISCPKTIKTTYCKKFWKSLINMLINLRILSPNDLAEIEHMILILEFLREVDKKLAETDFLNPQYDVLLDRQTKLYKQWASLSAKYYISPVARQKMIVDNLAIEKSRQEIEINSKKSTISNLLSNRENKKVQNV